MQWNVIHIYLDLFGSRQMPVCISVLTFVCALLCQILKDDNAETKCRRVFLHISYKFLFIIFSDLNFNALDVLQAWVLSKFHFNVIWPYFFQDLYLTNNLSFFHLHHNISNLQIRRYPILKYPECLNILNCSLILQL